MISFMLEDGAGSASDLGDVHVIHPDEAANERIFDPWYTDAGYSIDEGGSPAARQKVLQTGEEARDHI